MNYSNELIEKAKQSKSAEELLAIAKAENIELSAEEAESAFNKLHRTGELSDEELDNVAGGCGDDSENEKSKVPVPKFNISNKVYINPERYRGTVVDFKYQNGTFIYDIVFDYSPFCDSMGRWVEYASYEEKRLERIV